MPASNESGFFDGILKRTWHSKSPSLNNLQDNIAMHHIIYCTCPNLETAERIARQLVSDKLAACVNILPGVKSIYQWQGQIETAQEHLLLIKSPQVRFAAIDAAIKALHPYQLPEIIAVTIENGSAEYLKWIDSCLSTD
jgi:periplasmic divalent cation tolerance protein